MQKRIITIALRGITLVPGMNIYLDMERNMSIAAATSAQKEGSQIFLVAQKDANIENPGAEELETYGVVASVKQIVKTQNQCVRVLFQVEEAARLNEVVEFVPYFVSEVETNEVSELEPDKAEAMYRVLRQEAESYAEVKKKLGKEIKFLIEKSSDLETLSRELAGALRLSPEQRLKYLELYYDLEARYGFLLEWLMKETNIERYRSEFQEKVKHSLDKHQKEYILREQLKIIHEELGDSAASETERYEKALKTLKAPEVVKEQIAHEIKKLRQLHNMGPEVGICQNYIETLLAMPWEIRTEESLSMKAAKSILEEDHYGLKKVKEQVLEFLAVRKLKGDSAGSVLCLVGPPGTGKTSIARSIAKALNRKYVRVSLGGVHDEAEIRGHRRTYVGAMPGRIVAAIRKAGVKNPLILLDELDKTSNDSYKGDVSAALLEVLDREQNNTFSDHYLELPLDLSEVLFIATANTLDTIPRPLLDRMEIVEVGSYMPSEKLQIASRYLIPKQMERCGLPKGALRINKAALELMIQSYTRESGVRGLERTIETICKKAALEHLEDTEKRISVTARNLEQYLGKKKRRVFAANEAADIGIVRGLAWTQVGGDTLQIEVNSIPGTGKLVLTGQMGDVMKESAQIALSYVRATVEADGITKEYFETHDIHLHIPEGAVPKDGPSAGITMALAMYSAVTQKKVRPDLAMTGEISLRGRVMPIGGLKEKLSAAKEAGMKLVLIPKENELDLKEIPEEITTGLEIRPVYRMDEVYHAAFCD